MKFLVDNALSPIIAAGLKQAGFDAIHVRDIGLREAKDSVVFNKAVEEECILISADTDFATIISTIHTKAPSIILFRHGTERHPEKQLVILLANLPALQESLEQGSIIVIEPTRIRIRFLPIYE